MAILVSSVTDSSLIGRIHKPSACHPEILTKELVISIMAINHMLLGSVIRGVVSKGKQMQVTPVLDQTLFPVTCTSLILLGC